MVANIVQFISVYLFFTHDNKIVLYQCGSCQIWYIGLLENKSVCVVREVTYNGYTMIIQVCKFNLRSKSILMNVAFKRGKLVGIINTEIHLCCALVIKGESLLRKVFKFCKLNSFSFVVSYLMWSEWAVAPLKISTERSRDLHLVSIKGRR